MGNNVNRLKKGRIISWDGHSRNYSSSLVENSTRLGSSLALLEAKTWEDGTILVPINLSVRYTDV